MKRNHILFRCSSLLMALVLTGCTVSSPGDGKRRTDIQERQQGQDVPEPVHGIGFDPEINPESFSIYLHTENGTVQVNAADKKRTVEQYKTDGDRITWEYPGDEVSVSVKQAEDYLSVSITSLTAQDNGVSWPGVLADSYYLPFGEGKRVPADDPVWKEYLEGQEFPVMEKLSMPFWAEVHGDYAVLFIMENPFHTMLEFQTQPDLAFDVRYEYPAIEKEKTKRFRIYLTENNPVSVAKIYRRYVQEKGTFVTLEQKADDNPDIGKLFGAPFIYLWGERVISPEDVDWKAFRESFDTPVIEYTRVFGERQPRDGGTAEYLSALQEIGSQDYVAEYQKNVICNYLSHMLVQPDFYNPSVFTETTPKLDVYLDRGYGSLNDSERIQANKQMLAANLPLVFKDPDRWMHGDTVGFVEELQEAGIGRAWIGLNSWEQAYAKPELVKAAADAGYLIGSYDSYHSIHEPGQEQWITARFDDASLYEKATVTDKDGNSVKGFQGVGRKLNPTLSLTAVKERMQGIMKHNLPFNSWFIDCDATGEIYDDYTPEHITTQRQDMEARLERMAYIRNQFRMVIGSEGGNDFAASTIAFAHGIEMQSFSWMDEDMKNNRDSEFYIGRYYNPKGGVAEHFSKRIPIKDKYYTLFANPGYDVPLFRLVYHDSVITSYHWDWSTFKIQGLTGQRMVREVLYDVPPLYHLDGEQWKEYKDDLVRHTTVWSGFSQKAAAREMTDFQYLTEDGLVQMTEYGENLRAVANFSDKPVRFGEKELPACSVLMEVDGRKSVYTPSPEHT